jgi:hypothetical protein
MFGIVKALIHFVLGIIQFLLAIRFILVFFSVSNKGQFVSWIYEKSAPIVSPLGNIFKDWKLGSFIVSFNTLFALIVYSLAGYLILQIFNSFSTKKKNKAV